MQTVSQAWLDNQRQTLVNESYVEISLDIADPDALADASSEDNGAVYISDTSRVVSEVDKAAVPYCTLEQNIWVLDGSRKHIPSSDYSNNGYIGDILSSEDGTFESKLPTITINFSKVHQNIIPAVTITWGSAYDEFATDFIVTAYNGDTEVARKEVTGNTSVMTIVDVDIIDYDRITVRILRWCLPNRRARVAEIFVGMTKVYSKSDLFGYSHSQSVDPISTSLPKANISFSVDNTDDSYNPYNERGLSKYLMERQEIKTRYGFKMSDGTVEWIKGGTFYLSEWDAAQSGMTAEFKARDLLEFMSATFYKGIYNPDGTNLYDLAIQLLEYADLPLNDDGSVKWNVDESLKNIYTHAPLPIDSIANNLQLIANAAECVLYQDREGVLRIEPLSDSKTDYGITLFNSYSKSEITLSKPLKEVDVKIYQHFAKSESEELYNGTLTISGTSEITLTYSNMAKNVTATVTGGTLESAEYYSNACILTVTAEGEVTIIVNGERLEESTANTIVSSGTNGETITVDNPLITTRERALAVGAWIEKYLRNRKTLSSSWRADPRVDALDIVENQNEYTTSDVRLTDVTFNYAGAFRGTSEGRVV